VENLQFTSNKKPTHSLIDDFMTLSFTD